jgi:hypothetical protein
MTKKFDELREKMSPEAQARVEAAAERSLLPTIKLSTTQEVILCWLTGFYGDMQVKTVDKDEKSEVEDDRVFVVYNEGVVVAFFPCGSTNVIVIKKEGYIRDTFGPESYKAEQVINYIRECVEN